MLTLKQYKKYFVYLIEGAQGNGKSLLACILAHNLRFRDKVKIASNMTFPNLEFTYLESEEQLFKLTDTFIFLDEFDLMASYQSQQDSIVYYNNLLKNIRKNNNVLIGITQMCHMLPYKFRAMMNMIGMICYPKIHKRFDSEVIIHWKDNEFETDISPVSYLKYQWFNYNNEICSGRVNLFQLRPYFQPHVFYNLYFWFRKYNTLQKIDRLKTIELEDRKRKKKKKKETD